MGAVLRLVFDYSETEGQDLGAFVPQPLVGCCDPDGYVAG